MTTKDKYQPSQKAQAFLDSVENGKYKRQIITGIKKFLQGKVEGDIESFYSASELEALAALKDTALDVEARMPVKITQHYYELAKNSLPLQTLVKASPKETGDLDGSADPGKQMDYSPVEGLIHKYELGLIYVALTCSAHCRFCYREELIAKKDVKRPDGTFAPKGLAQIGELTTYIKQHNEQVAGNGGRHPDTGRERLREILMSGGDPMVLGNKNIAAWWSALADAGIESIRIGTKELAFFPDRFDATFFDMVDKFHAAYPGTKLRFMVHFNHPDEFLQKDENGQYIDDPAGGLVWVESTARAMRELGRREWLTIDNQAPIIKGINDDADALRIMQREMRRNRVENHYFFCGRDIIGHKAFNVPIERVWQLLNESQKGLSGVEAHARLSITHYKGKTEVAAVCNEPLAGVPGTENGFVILKLLRGAEDAPDRGKVTIVGRNPEAIWFSGYNDRVIYDEAGLFADVVEEKSEEEPSSEEPSAEIQAASAGST
jgi:L-lysine 2,3-aminomutase